MVFFCMFFLLWICLKLMNKKYLIVKLSSLDSHYEISKGNFILHLSNWYIFRTLCLELLVKFGNLAVFMTPKYFVNVCFINCLKQITNVTLTIPFFCIEIEISLIQIWFKVIYKERFNSIFENKYCPFWIMIC